MYLAWFRADAPLGACPRTIVSERKQLQVKNG
jgi:hypothetical protein